MMIINETTNRQRYTLCGIYTSRSTPAGVFYWWKKRRRGYASWRRPGYRLSLSSVVDWLLLIHGRLLMLITYDSSKVSQSFRLWPWLTHGKLNANVNHYLTWLDLGRTDLSTGLLLTCLSHLPKMWSFASVNAFRCRRLSSSGMLR